MENRLTLNDNVKSFLEIDNRPIWKLIIENDIDNLLALQDEEDVLDIAKELFSTGESQILKEYDFATIRESNGAFIRDLVRLIFALDINGTQDEMLKKVADPIFDSLPALTERIQKETFGYPTARVVDDYILSEAALVRAALMNLIYYYRVRQDIDALHFVTVMRTTITLAIMRSYKNVVGHDMVETARIKEEVGETEAALTFYNSARDNLKNELQWFVESPEMGPNE